MIVAASKKTTPKTPLLFICVICFVLLMSSTVRQYASMYLVSYPLAFFNMYTTYLKYEAVTREFNNMSNVDIISIDHYDGIISALVKVRNKGVLGMGDLHVESFHDYPHLFINRIGPWEIISACYRQGEYVGNTNFNVGIQGKQSEFFPFKLHNVSDIVDNYDEILNVIQTWPQNIIDPRVVDVKNKVTEEDGECYFGIKKTNLLIYSN